MKTRSTSEARKHFSDVANQAACAGERTIIERRGKPLAAVVSIEDLEALEALEDQLDVLEAKKRLAGAREEDFLHLGELGDFLVEEDE